MGVYCGDQIYVAITRVAVTRSRNESSTPSRTTSSTQTITSGTSQRLDNIAVGAGSTSLMVLFIL